MIRFFLFLSLFISPLGLSYVSASSSDKAGGGVSHTEHPPHDHPSGHDHLKKLDESLRRSREDDSSKGDDD